MNTIRFLMMVWCGAALASAADARKTELPLTKVVLFSSGVGYFEREGEVEGNASAEFKFERQEINDLLKSLVVRHGGGDQSATVHYESSDPLDRRLRSFEIDLTDNPGLGELLNKLRGEEVELHRPNPTRGRIVGVEKRTETLKEERTVDREYVNLLGTEGLLSIALDQIQRIRLVDSRLNSEFEEALGALASASDTQKKSLTVQFEGEGKRPVQVSYIIATPVWKTSYRLVLDEKEKPFLQGWAIVENTGDEDWKAVRLGLISGRPLSFTMDLYQPLYATRPEVKPELYAALRPQVYEDTMELGRMAGIGGGGVAPPPPAAAPMMRSLAADKRAGLAVRGRQTLALTESAAAADMAGESQLAMQKGSAVTEEAGELFEYRLAQPVTLERQKSAMLPILSEEIEGKKLSIYNPNVQAKHPLHGFRLKNSSSLYLMQGPITVYEEGTYAGDAQITDLAPGQERLISFALDQRIEVAPRTKQSPVELLSASLRKGLLITSRKVERTREYEVRNKDRKARTLLIEQPLEPDWELISPKKGVEKTRDHHRFEVQVPANASTNVVAIDQRQFREEVQLLNLNSELIGFYLRSNKISAKVKEALQKYIGLRTELDRIIEERGRLEQRVQEITQEQGRIRENMARLNQSSELYARYVKKFDEQETELENLRESIRKQQEAEKAKKTELDDYLMGLEIE